MISDDNETDGADENNDDNYANGLPNNTANLRYPVLYSFPKPVHSKVITVIHQYYVTSS